ncbi:hypothetical protein A11A3_01370 [Alcanivorax hongdengensis A-11-3]|uniref:Uncharacterized protein n=1 Tax=Alcanivorax hongdengensis A-11-3 TaxID=1177179 RepID=L0WIU8_9GAMM|nr:pilin [Alcanivorax hongdengensis]EKF76102.1 hypothetical protein A11A3_01370 [Alcanivorax hongdengensis A-11-3]
MRVVIFMLLLVLGAPLAAMSLGMAKVEQAAPGESQQQVCERAMAAMTEELHNSLLSVIAATGAYQARLEAYRKLHRSEDALRDAYLSVLQDQKPELEGRRWNGQRCVLRADYDGDIDQLAARIPVPAVSEAAVVKDRDAPPPGVDSRTWELFSTSRDRSELARVMGVVSGIRIRMAEFYMQTGNWPEDLQQLGVAPEQLVGPGIKQAALWREGMLKVDLAGRLAGHHLNTWPVDSGVRGIEWKCSTDVEQGPQPFCEPLH